MEGNEAEICWIKLIKAPVSHELKHRGFSIIQNN